MKLNPSKQQKIIYKYKKKVLPKILLLGRESEEGGGEIAKCRKSEDYDPPI